MNAHQRRTSTRLGLRLMRAKAAVGFTTRTWGRRIGRVVAVDKWSGLCYVEFATNAPNRLIQRSLPAHHLRRVGGV